MPDIKIKPVVLNTVYKSLKSKVRKLDKKYKKSLDKKGNVNWKLFTPEEMGKQYSLRAKLAFLEQLANGDIDLPEDKK